METHDSTITATADQGSSESIASSPKSKKRKFKSHQRQNASKQKFKDKKLRLKFENVYKDRMLDSLRDDIDEKELELERLVFGGENDVLEQLDSRLSDDEEDGNEEERENSETRICDNDVIPEKAVEQQKIPAWQDEDDDNILVSEKIATIKNCHHSMLKRVDEKYETLAREKFLKLHGEPGWASLDKKSKNVDSDESEAEELLQKTSNFILKSSSLKKDKILLKKCQNLTEANYQMDVIRCVEFHPLSKVAVAAGYSGSATLYQVDGDTNAKIQTVHFKKFSIDTAHFTKDGNELVVGSGEHGHYFVYDMIAGKVNKVLQERGMEQLNVKRFCMSPDGKLMVINGRYGKIHLVSVKSKEWIDTLKMNGEVVAVSFNADGSRMYSHGENGEVYVWDINSRLCIHKFIDEGCITGTSVALSPNQQYLATGSDSGVVNVYDVSSVMASKEPKPLKAVMNLTTEVTSSKFNSTSEILAIASSFKVEAIKLVHFPSMTVFSNFPGRGEVLRYVSSIDISPNSGYMMLGNNVGKVYLYRLQHYENY